MNTKKCYKCETVKSTDAFHKNKSKKDGLASECKACCNARNKNRSQIEAVKKRKKEYDREYYQKNKQKKHAQHKKWREENREAALNIQRRYDRKRHERLKDCPEYRISNTVRVAVREALRGRKKSERTFEALPYTPAQLKEHIESQFEDWMTWDNYGTWHIDHIYPQSKLPYDSLEHPNFQKCWALENLRPLDAIENIKKGDKV
jgi:hypothetical protein